MKFVMFLSSFLFVSLVHAKNCQEIKGFEVFGETISYEPQGSEIVKVMKWYPLPEYLSEHLGSYHNIKVKAEERVNSLEFLGVTYSMSSKIANNYQTLDFGLQKILMKKKIHGPIQINFMRDKKLICTYETKVQTGD